MTTGIIFAIIAMFCWGFGDFLIQRSTREMGDFETLFLITFFGAVILLPFVWHEVVLIFYSGGETLWVLLVGGIILFVAALLEFEALKKGKISVIEPTWSVEIPATAFFAFIVLGEVLTTSQLFIIIGLMIGLFLVSYKGKVFSHKFLFEKGVPISIFAALVMGTANFFVGWGARESSPLMVNFFISTISFIGSGIFLFYKKKWGNVWDNVRKYPKTVLPMVILDNGAWIVFAFAMTLAPLALTTAISESYIVIAVLLGIFISREKLEKHQKLGLLLAICSAILLATQLG